LNDGCGLEAFAEAEAVAMESIEEVRGLIGTD
jgi:hypothetical protein